MARELVLRNANGKRFPARGESSLDLKVLSSGKPMTLRDVLSVLQTSGIICSLCNLPLFVETPLRLQGILPVSS